MKLDELFKLMELSPREYIDAVDTLGMDDLRKMANYTYALHKASKYHFKDKSLTIWERVLRTD